MQNIMCCQAEHVMRGAYLLQQENQHFRGFSIKFICCIDIPCSKDYATSCVGAWESKSLPSPGDELPISLTDRVASGCDLGWEDGLMVMLLYTFKLAREAGGLCCVVGENKAKTVQGRSVPSRQRLGI